MTTPTPSPTDYHGMPAIYLSSPDGAEAIVLKHGGQLVSWKPANGTEQIYVSPNAIYNESVPVRGGIPVIFPQFSKRGGLKVGHGFARLMNWELVDTRVGDDYALTHLRLTDTAETRAQWPHEFTLEIAVNISGNRLDVELDVCNTGSASFDFTAALHTYLAVREVEQCSVEGLHGLAYTDSLTKTECLETSNPLIIDQEVDRIYYDSKKPLLLNEPQRGLVIQTENMPDIVVWNPWEKRCSEFTDMPKNGFRHMICIEAAVIKNPIKLAPGEEWSGRQTFVVLA